MQAFGVRFAIDDPERFASLRSLFDALKKDKDAGVFRDPEAWKTLVPDDVKSKFSWPSAQARALWLARRPPIVVTASSRPPWARP